MQSTSLRLFVRQFGRTRVVRNERSIGLLIPSCNISSSRSRYYSTNEQTTYAMLNHKRSSHTATASHDWSSKDAMQQVLELCDYNNQFHHNNKRNESSGLTVSDEDLDRAAQLFQYRIKEARLCVADCKECVNSEEIPHEVATAESAIQESVSCLVEFLDTLRDAGVEQQERFRQIREEAVLSIRDVRSELNSFKGSISE